MKKYKLILSYDGTDYGGWQIQPHIPTIQETVQRAVTAVTGEQSAVVAAGRTDAGVHALGQVAHCALHHPYEPNDLLQKLNCELGGSIRVRAVDEVPLSFHARYSAGRKFYRYTLNTAAIEAPLTRRYATHLRYPIDFKLLQQALALFVGTKDFTAFANENQRGSAARDPVKTVYAIRCLDKETRFEVMFEGSGFLYKMVRNLMATALKVAQGTLPLGAIDALFVAKNRALVPAPAPARGLCLVAVHYP